MGLIGWIIIIMGVLLLLYQVIERWKDKEKKCNKFLFVITLILIVLGTYMKFYEARQADIKQKQAATSGELSQKSQESPKRGVTVTCGGNTLYLSGDRIWSGEYFNLGELTGLFPPLNVKITEDKLYISMEIFDFDGMVIAIIHDNEWDLNRNNYFQRNYDDFALEVIGVDNIPYLQIELAGNYEIKLGGVFITKGKVTIVTDSILVSLVNEVESNQELKDAIEEVGGISPWFKYPSDMYLGKWAKKQN